MSRLLETPLLLVLLSLAASLAGPPKNPPRPLGDNALPALDLPTWDYRFPTGLRVIVQPDNAAGVASIATVVDRGSSSDPEGKGGLAHLVEHLWFRSRHGDLPPVRDVLAQLGCRKNASTGPDTTDYRTACPADAMPVMLRLESLRLTQPLVGVAPERMAIEREVVRNELRMRTENTVRAVMPYLYAQLYPEGHPYARDGVGSHATLDAIELPDAQALTAESYVPENTTIVIAGNLGAAHPGTALFANMDPSLFHPRLTEEHLRRWPLVDAADPDDPDQWYIWPVDPDHPDQQLAATRDIRPRAPAQAPDPVDPPQREPARHVAAVTAPKVVLAWTLPGGRPETDRTLSLSALLVQGALRQLPKRQVQDAGCFAWVGRLDTRLICAIEVLPKADRERIANSVLRNLDEATSSEMNSAAGFYQRSANTNAVFDLILQMGDIADIHDGRPSGLAHHVHESGSVLMFNEELAEIASLDVGEAQGLVRRWVKRSRAAIVFLDPMPLEDRILDSSESTHEVGDAEVRTTALDASIITPATIVDRTRSIDPSRVGALTLPNGLRVVALQNESVPFSRAALVFGRGPSRDLDELAEVLHEARAESPGPWRGRMSERSSLAHTTYEVQLPTKNLGAGLWLLRKRAEDIRTEPTDVAGWVRRRQERVSDAVIWSAFWERRAVREALDPASPARPLYDHAYYDAVGKLDRKRAAAALKLKYQPANATLVIVSGVEPRQALAQANHYLGGWQPSKKVAVGPLPRPAVPAPPAAVHKVMLLNTSVETQTKVSLTCVVPPVDAESAEILQLASDLISARLFDRLRTRQGATYGAYASPSIDDDGSAQLRLHARMQNDGAAQALQTFLDLIADAESSGFDADSVRLAAFARGLAHPLRTQSLDAQAAWAGRSIRLGADASFFTHVGQRLSKADPAAIRERLAGCTDRYVVSLTGPLDVLRPQLDAAGVEYEVLDWAQDTLDYLDAHDPKAAAKERKRREELWDGGSMAE